MKKSVKCAVLSVLMVFCLIFSLPLTTLAAESYQMYINEPAIGDNQGYINLLIESTSGVRSVICISWTMVYINVDSSEPLNSTDMNITIDSDNKVTFTGLAYADGSLSVGFARSLSGYNRRNLYWSVYSSSGLASYDYSLGTNKVIGFQIYGNGVLLSHDLGDNNNFPFTVTWGDDSESVSLMTEMLAELYVMADNDETIIGQLNDLLGHAQTAEELLIDIDHWVNSCNDKLQDIKLRVRDIIDLLEQLINAQGESTFEEPDTSGLNDYNNAEGELVSGAEDTSDIEEEIGNFEIDVNASNSIWDIINRFLNSNPKVFGLAIGMLCLGIIALILNR